MPERGRPADAYIASRANVSTGWVGTDCVVLDSVNGQAHALSGHAAEVWADIEAGRPLDPDHPATQTAVRRFAELGLITSTATGSPAVRRLSRRGALKAGALTGLSAVTITSIALPSAAMAASYAVTDPYAWVYPSTGSFVIPAGGTVHLTMVGGGGGASSIDNGIAAAPFYVTLMNPVGNGSQTVDVYPGGGGFGGAGDNGGAGGSATLGGFRGGSGGTETDPNMGSGGGGGGAATVISTGGVIIAGAGGGAGSGYANPGSATPTGGASGTEGEAGPPLTDTPVTNGGGGGGYPNGGEVFNTNCYSGDSAANPSPPANLVVSTTATASAAFAGFDGLGAQGAKSNGPGGGGGVLVVGDITGETGGASVSDTPA